MARMSVFANVISTSATNAKFKATQCVGKHFESKTKIRLRTKKKINILKMFTNKESTANLRNTEMWSFAEAPVELIELR